MAEHETGMIPLRENEKTAQPIALSRCYDMLRGLGDAALALPDARP